MSAEQQVGRMTVLDRPNGRFEVRDCPVPDPAPGTILIQQEMCGVCGTDIHIYRGHLPGIEYPVALGHEFVGIIAALGKGVSEDYLGNPVKVGDRVIVGPDIDCGKCFACIVDKTPSLCEDMLSYGVIPESDSSFPFSGGFADYVYCSYPGTVFFKTELPPEVAVLMEPLTPSVYANLRSRMKLGDTVVIQGSGAIGILCQVSAKLAGASKIIHVGGPTDYRIEMAREFGADVTINISEVRDQKERVKLVRAATPRGQGADVIFECAGVPAAMEEGLNMLRRNGTYVVVGHFSDVGTIRLNPFTHFCDKHINLYGAWGAEPTSFVKGLSILEKRQFPYEKLVTHVLPLHRLNEVVQLPERGYILDDKEAVKVVISSIAK